MFKPKTLLILSLLVLVSAAYLAYWNQSKAYKQAIGIGVEEDNRLTITENTLKKLTTERDDLDKTEEDFQEKIKGLNKDLDRQQDMNAALKSDLRALNEKAKYYKDNPDAIREQEDKVRIAIQNMSEIKLLKKEIQELDKMVADREGHLDRLTAVNTDLEGNISAMREHIESRSGGRSVSGMETSIRAVYNNWGFVTLNDGDKNGVVMNSTLDVVRKGNTVAKLLVTIVEQDSASANIIPGSVAPDTVLMIGDKVVPAKTGVAAN